MEEENIHNATPPFQIPDQYFARLEKKIMLQVSEEQPVMGGVLASSEAVYQVPVGYFETLPWKIRSLAEEKQKNVLPKVRLQWQPMAMAASLALLIAISVRIGPWLPTQVPSAVSSNAVTFASGDILSYLENEEDPVVTEEITRLAFVSADELVISGNYDRKVIEEEIDEEDFISEEL